MIDERAGGERGAGARREAEGRPSAIARRLLAALSLLAFLAAGGCTGARPWEKGNLAKPKMALDPDPEAALLEQHVFAYREGSVGGYGGGGGGCGCN